jgi:hypothetical protein
MKLYFYNENELHYQKINTVKIVLLGILFVTLTYLFGVVKGRKDHLENLTPSEVEFIVLNMADTTRQFSKAKMINLMKDLNMKFPHIALAQSLIETGHFESKIFRENNNLFGMKQARTRVNTAKGTQYSHAYYDTWQESVYDYAFYQCRYLGSLHTEDEYLAYLSRSYAEDPNYVSKIKTLIQKENLKSLFE